MFLLIKFNYFICNYNIVRMYKISNDLKLNGRCTTVDISKRNDFISICEDSNINIFQKENLINSSSQGLIEPLQIIRQGFDLVYCKFSNLGDKLVCSDLDYVIVVYDVDSNFNQIMKFEPGIRNFNFSDYFFSQKLEVCFFAQQQRNRNWLH